jgi:hypothetical protein
MLLKLKDILFAKETLNHINNQKTSAKMAYILARNYRKLNTEITSIEDQRIGLLKELGEKVKGKPDDFREVPKKNKESFIKQFGELLETEIEIDIRKFKIEDLSIEITPDQISRISWMIETETDEKTDEEIGL